MSYPFQLMVICVELIVLVVPLRRYCSKIVQCDITRVLTRHRAVCVGKRRNPFFDVQTLPVIPAGTEYRVSSMWPRSLTDLYRCNLIICIVSWPFYQLGYLSTHTYVCGEWYLCSLDCMFVCAYMYSIETIALLLLLKTHTHTHTHTPFCKINYNGTHHTHTHTHTPFCKINYNGTSVC
jgi:hypothetical protein